MKCNHCKKIIPQGEEIITDKKKEKQYLHEECFNSIQKQKQEEKLQLEEKRKKDNIKVGMGMTLIAIVIAGFLCLRKKFQS